MDKTLQLIIVSLVSLAIGVGGTMFFESPSEAEKNRNMTSESLSTGEEKSKLEKAESEVETLKKSLEEAEAKANAPADYFKLNTELAKINKDIQTEIAKKYETIELRDKANQVKLHYVYSKLISFQKTKTSWYTATINHGEKNKLVYYFNYYSCAQPELPYEKAKASSKDACFTMWAFAFFNNKWEQYSYNSNVDSFLWHADTPFLVFEAEKLTNFAEQTHMLRSFLPIPDEDGKVTYLKYNSGKITWEDAAASIDWVPTTPVEAEKFRKDLQK